MRCDCGAHLLFVLQVRAVPDPVPVACPRCGRDVLDERGQQIVSVIAVAGAVGK
jgi:hypothetical protein